MRMIPIAKTKPSLPISPLGGANTVAVKDGGAERHLLRHKEHDSKKPPSLPRSGLGRGQTHGSEGRMGMGVPNVTFCG